MGIEYCADLGKHLAFSGLSMCCGPDGLAISVGGSTHQEVLRCIIDPSLGHYTRTRDVNNYLQERRPELYVELLKVGDST